MGGWGTMEGGSVDLKMGVVNSEVILIPQRMLNKTSTWKWLPVKLPATPDDPCANYALEYVIQVGVASADIFCETVFLMLFTCFSRSKLIYQWLSHWQQHNFLSYSFSMSSFSGVSRCLCQCACTVVYELLTFFEFFSTPVTNFCFVGDRSITPLLSTVLHAFLFTNGHRNTLCKNTLLVDRTWHHIQSEWNARH